MRYCIPKRAEFQRFGKSLEHNQARKVSKQLFVVLKDKINLLGGMWPGGMDRNA
jgi:hypothetical protein